ncbi:HU family DNA-binding protein [Phocaeicola sp.]
MPINYSIAMYSNPIIADAPRKAYAKSQYTNILTLDKFAEHIASHGSKYNRADIYAVLMQTVDCMREMLLEGKRIEMGDLGVFSISIQGQGAESLEAFNPAIHIEQLNVNWTPGDRFRNLIDSAVFNLVPSRRSAKILLKSIKAGETTVDLTGSGADNSEAVQNEDL